jgi:hypothetical protein
MKRILLMAALVSSSFFMSSYAGEIKTSPVVAQAFQNEFDGAKEIVWEQVGVLHKATFVLDGNFRSAFYNGDGELVAITQNVPTTKLPKQLKASLKHELQGRWITDAFVVSVEGDNTYYVTLENADTTVTLKSAGTKKWTVYQKSDK